MSTQHSRNAFTLIELVIVLAIMAVLTGLSLAAVQRARASADRAACGNNLRQIGLAFEQYHNQHQALPPGMSQESYWLPMGWHVRLLPYLEQEPLWRRTETAFRQRVPFSSNPPHSGLGTLVQVFECPADPSAHSVHSVHLFPGSRVAPTSYLGVEGTNLYRRDGLLFTGSHVRFADVSDGLSNTLLVGERPAFPENGYGLWYTGQWGQTVRSGWTGSAGNVLGVRERRSQLTFFVDTDCSYGPYHFSPGRGDNLCDSFHFWSNHPGGGSFLFADGSVRFLGYAADSVLPALATRAGGETLSDPD